MGSKQEVLRNLGPEAQANLVIYFYCHADSQTDLGQPGIGLSWLMFSNKEKLSLAELKEKAPQEQRIPGYPIVFVNACESAELSPLFYDGFIPYFMAKGARGVIGTECEVPGQFALEWSKRFFELFLQGFPVGEIFLTLRREFYTNHHNILGLPNS